MTKRTKPTKFLSRDAARRGDVWEQDAQAIWASHLHNISPPHCEVIGTGGFSATASLQGWHIGKSQLVFGATVHAIKQAACGTGGHRQPSRPADTDR
jgi:hypothetical protein